MCILLYSVIVYCYCVLSYNRFEDDFIYFSLSGSKGTSEEDFSTSDEYFWFPGAHTVERTSGEEGEKESPRKRIFKHPRSQRRERGSSRSCTVDYSNQLLSTTNLIKSV